MLSAFIVDEASVKKNRSHDILLTLDWSLSHSETKDQPYMLYLHLPFFVFSLTV